MSNTKNLYRIQNALFNQPWLIKPSVHQSLVDQFMAHISNPSIQMPMPDDMPDDEEDDMEEMSIIDPGSPMVAVIPVEGIIGKHLGLMETMCGGCDIDQVAADLKAAVEDPAITDIILAFSTPGGTVTGVMEMGQMIAEASAKKRCIAFTDTLCASAGYWMASQCTAFYCSPSAEVGSIGVYSLLMDESVALANAGVKVNAISAGKFKLAGAPFKPLDDEERKMFQEQVDKIYSQFKSAVSSARGLKDEDMQGQVFDGETAVTKNLVDGNVNSLEELLDLLTTK